MATGNLIQLNIKTHFQEGALERGEGCCWPVKTPAIKPLN